jgi:probable addiction module antidote protein
MTAGTHFFSTLEASVLKNKTSKTPKDFGETIKRGRDSMPRSRPYTVGLSQRLKDPEHAAAYLTAAARESRAVFLLALRDVATAHKISKIAAAAGVNRESLYRALSAKGNPSYETLDGILTAVGIEGIYRPRAQRKRPVKSKSAHAQGSYRRDTSSLGRQLVLDFQSQGSRNPGYEGDDAVQLPNRNASVPISEQGVSIMALVAADNPIAAAATAFTVTLRGT